MGRETQLEFLQRALQNEIELRLMDEVNYRVLTASAMAAKKVNDPVFSKQGETKQICQLRNMRIHYIEELIKEVEKGDFKFE